MPISSFLKPPRNSACPQIFLSSQFSLFHFQQLQKKPIFVLSSYIDTVKIQNIERKDVQISNTNTTYHKEIFIKKVKDSCVKTDFHC